MSNFWKGETVIFFRIASKEAYIPIVESCVIGLVAGLSAVILSSGVSWLGTLRVHFSDVWPSRFVLPVFGLVGGLIAGLLVEKVAPEASGSGIPQVRARLDRIVMPLDLRIALVKLLGGTVALGSGFFLGKEGPTVQLGAALAAPITKLMPTTAEYKRQLTAAGAAAGLAAAFNAPLAGVTFLLEELLKEMKPITIIIAIVACSVSAMVLNFFNPLHLHKEVITLSPSISFGPEDIPYYAILGIVAGLCGALFNSHILAALNFNRQMPQMSTTIKIALAGLLSGLIIALLPDNFHNYAGMRALIVAGETSWYSVVVAFIGFYMLTLLAYGSGAPGGLFAPSLAIGSTLGYMVGNIEQILTGSGSTAAFALVGMGAFFSAVARTPLTAIVITFELTCDFTLLMPLMLACVISSAVGELIFRGGLYDHLMRWNGINLRGLHSDESIPVENIRALKAMDVMHKKVKTFSGSTLVKDVLPAFSSSAQKGFAVVEKGILVGIVTQTDLTRISEVALLEKMTVSEIMTPHPVAVHSHDSLEDILFLFSYYKFTWLPVTYHDKLEGIIFQSDVLKAVFAEADKQAEKAAELRNEEQQSDGKSVDGTVSKEENQDASKIVKATNATNSESARNSNSSN